MIEINIFSLFFQVLGNLFNMLISQWWIIPILIVGVYFKSSSFKGKVGEAVVNTVNSAKLDRSIYITIKDITIRLHDETTTQIDHIIVSKYGIFVIETKNMKGWIYGTKEQRNWTQNIYGKKHTFQNPLHQNYRHIKAIEELLGFKDNIYSVVVFIGDCELKSNMPENVFFNIKYITYIKSFTRQVFSNSQVNEIIRLIKSGSLVKGRTINKEHIKSLKNRNYTQAKQICKKCGGSMIQRINKRTKEKFLGCSNYPRCKNTEKL